MSSLPPTNSATGSINNISVVVPPVSEAAVTQAPAEVAQQMPVAATDLPQRRKLFGVEVDPLTMEAAVDQLWQWIEAPTAERGCRYVVTPNVDHAVLLQENKDLRDAYRDAHLVLADGHPVVLASRLLNQPVPERVAGSELVPCLFDYFNQLPSGSLKVFLLGAAEGVAETASQNMAKQWPNVQTVGVYSPPMGFEKDPQECANILARIAQCKPDVVIVGLGAPKQELWVHQHHQLIESKVALCVGATIDFLAGEKRRAPYWMQRSGLEWAHRMFSEPKRLVKRYAKDAWIFPQIVAKQWLAATRESVAKEQAESAQQNMHE